MSQPDVDQLAAIMAEAIAVSVGPLLVTNRELVARIQALEQQASVPGPRGEVGPAGPQGAVGPIGPMGEPGPQGERGTPGAPGEAGPRGELGPPGAGGPAGEQGPRGERGEQGDGGPVGPAGERGVDGLQGIAGRDGLPGVQGPQGDKGTDGKSGMDGVHGKDGRDGTLENIKLMPIDERTAEWCFKDGTPVDGGRMHWSYPVFKDTYDPSAVYRKDDLVQYGGGGWIALKDQPAMKPGTGSPEVTGWKLFIKPGRDGKHGRDGRDGIDGKIVEVLKKKGEW